MAETNEIKQVVEEKEVIVEETTEDKPIEGYSHLTEADLNPDYEPPQEAEENEVETEAQSEESLEVANESDSEESSNSSENDEVSSEKWSINGTTYSKDDVTTRMTKDYENLASFSGKQAEQIGGYKQRIQELESKLASDSHANTDANTDANANNPKKEYDIYTQDGIMDMIEDRAKAIVEEREHANQQKSQQDSWNSNANKARESFSNNHPEYSTEQDVIDLIQYGVSKGLALGDNADAESMTTYLETVHANKTGDYGFFTKESSGTESKKTIQEETIKRVEESSKVNTSLSNVNSSESSEIDYDSMNDAEWSKLPEEKRMELLGL